MAITRIDKESAVLRFKSLPSTNDYVRHHIGRGLEPGTVVVAEQQTSGRGRGTNKWTSPPGVGLYFSFYITPEIQPHHLGLFSLAVSVAVANAISTLAGVKVSLKWPNDIFFRDRKIGGILLESVINSGKVEHLIVGIGLNLNNRPDQLPCENAGSIFSITGLRLNKNIVLSRLLVSLNNLFHIVSRQKNWTTTTRNNWLELCHHNMKKVRIFGDDFEFEGRFVGLSDIGEALVLREDEQIQAVAFGRFSLREV